MNGEIEKARLRIIQARNTYTQVVTGEIELILKELGFPIDEEDLYQLIEDHLR